MRKLLVLVILMFVPGCAHGLGKSLDVVEKGGAGVGVAVEGSIDVWSAGVDAQVALCKAKGLGPDASEAERAQCMGLLGQGDQAEPAMEKLRDGYDMLAEALKLMREAEKELKPYLEAAEEALKR